MTKSLALLGVAVALSLSGCYVGVATDQPVLTSAEVDGEGYQPAYYDGYVVYYDEGGRPYYYDHGGAVWVASSSPYYVGLVNHWHYYGPAYRNWYAHAGYRYQGYRGHAGYHSYRGYRRH